VRTPEGLLTVRTRLDQTLDQLEITPEVVGAQEVASDAGLGGASDGFRPLGIAQQRDDGHSELFKARRIRYQHAGFAVDDLVLDPTDPARDDAGDSSTRPARAGCWPSPSFSAGVSQLAVTPTVLSASSHTPLARDDPCTSTPMPDALRGAVEVGPGRVTCFQV
jgi:hypothetical protein